MLKNWHYTFGLANQILINHDFLIRDEAKIVKAIQVAYSTGANMERETDGLLEALKTHKLSEGLILTMDDEKIIEKDGKKIIIKPAWKWMLEGQG